jgi:hypothetical protein
VSTKDQQRQNAGASTSLFDFTLAQTMCRSE